MFSDALRLSVMPGRAIVRLQLGARSQKTVSSLKVGRPLPAAVNTWSGDDLVIWRIAPDTWLLSSALHEAAEILPAGGWAKVLCRDRPVRFAGDDLDRRWAGAGPARLAAAVSISPSAHSATRPARARG